MEWNEREHPRDEKGQFSNKNSTSLTKVEWRLYYKKLSDLKIKYGEQYMKDGRIPPILIEDKLVISTGTFEKPKVLKIIKPTEDDWFNYIFGKANYHD